MGAFGKEIMGRAGFSSDCDAVEERVEDDVCNEGTGEVAGENCMRSS